MKIKKLLLGAALLGTFAALAVPRHIDTAVMWDEPFTRLAYYAWQQDDTTASIKAIDMALKKNKNNYLALDLLYNIHIAGDESKKAMAVADRLYRLSKGTDREGQATTDYAFQLLETKHDTVAAIGYALKATRLEGDETRSNILLGHIYASRGEMEKAKNYYVNALAIENSPSVYKIFLSELPATDPDYNLYARKGIQAAQDDPEALTALYVEICNSRIRANQNAESEIIPFDDILADAVACSRYEEQHLAYLPLYLCFDINPEKSTEYLENYCAGTADSKSAGVLYQYLANRYSDRRQYLKGLESALRGLAVAEGQDSSVAYGNIREILFSMGAYEDFVEEIDAQIQTGEIDSVGDNIHKRALATAYCELGKPREAKKILDEYCEFTRDEYDPLILNTRASIAMQMGNYDGAAYAYKELCDSSTLTNFVPGLVSLGDAYHFAGHRQDAAEAWSRAADAMLNDEMCKDDAPCWLPIVLHSLGRSEEAERYVESLIASNDFDGNVLYNLACYFTRSGQYDKALKWLEEALRHGSDPYHPLIDYDLRPLHEMPEFKAMTSEAQERLRQTVRDARKAAAAKAP